MPGWVLKAVEVVARKLVDMSIYKKYSRDIGNSNAGDPGHEGT